jgi:hypothetical protein
MITAIIFLLLKKHLNPWLKKVKVFQAIKRFKPAVPRNYLLFLCVFLAVSTLKAQEQSREYIVSYKGQNVGMMNLYQNQSGSDNYIKIISSVEMRVLFSIKVLTEEESVFKNGRMVYSKLSRNVNGKQKTSKHTRASGDVYHTSSGGENNNIQNINIDYNMHLLYLHEPVNITRVYSDNFQQFLFIQKSGDHRYKITLPDGNYNYYYFRNGICNKVEVHQSLYSVIIKLKE